MPEREREREERGERERGKKSFEDHTWMTSIILREVTFEQKVFSKSNSDEHNEYLMFMGKKERRKTGNLMKSKKSEQETLPLS